MPKFIGFFFHNIKIESKSRNTKRNWILFKTRNFISTSQFFSFYTQNIITFRNPFPNITTHCILTTRHAHPHFTHNPASYASRRQNQRSTHTSPPLSGTKRLYNIPSNLHEHHSASRGVHGSPPINRVFVRRSSVPR